MRAKSFVFRLKGLRVTFFIPLCFLLFFMPMAVYGIYSAFTVPEQAFFDIQKLLLTGIPLIVVFWTTLLSRDLVDSEIRELIYPYEIARHSQLPETAAITGMYYLFSMPVFFLFVRLYPDFQKDVLDTAFSVLFLTFFYSGMSYVFLYLTKKTLAGIILPILYYTLSVTMFANTFLDANVFFTPFETAQDPVPRLLVPMFLFAAGFFTERREMICSRIRRRIRAKA